MTLNCSAIFMHVYNPHTRYLMKDFNCYWFFYSLIYCLVHTTV